jgi:hypothetical protein
MELQKTETGSYEGAEVAESGSSGGGRVGDGRHGVWEARRRGDHSQSGSNGARVWVKIDEERKEEPPSRLWGMSLYRGHAPESGQMDRST